MNLVMNIDDFKIEHTFFGSPVKNIVIDGSSSFIKLIYSNTLTTLACIYIQIPIHILRIERYFNKVKYLFDPETFHNKKIIEKIYSIENAILEKMAIDKKPILHLYDKLSRGVISMSDEHSYGIQKRCLFLKISGIWETEYNYGVTFKFV